MHSKNNLPSSFPVNEGLKYFLEIKISNWLTTLLAQEMIPGKNNSINDESIESLLDITELASEELNLPKEYTTFFCKSVILEKCQHLLTKKEYTGYNKINDWSIKDFSYFIKEKLKKQNELEDLEINPDFKAFTTTTLLAQKMCSEFKITSLQHPKAGLLRSYISGARPIHTLEENWIQRNDEFLETVKKQKGAKNPITFIDLTHQETFREDDIHLKMWLYILMARKDDRKHDTDFFSLQHNNIATFLLTDNGCRLFERIFDASCKLHRKLINDPRKENHAYSISSLEDIQDIFLCRYQQPEKLPPSLLEKQNLDGFIDVAECLFHIGSHRLRGSKKNHFGQDQFLKIIQQPRDFKEKEPRKTLFDLTPFWEEVVQKFSEVIEFFGLTLQNGTGEKLTSRNFLSMIDKKTMKRSFPVKDREGNLFILSGRCKELESIVNKMLNTAKYSQIDAFNDILGTRFELHKAASMYSQDPKSAIENLFTTFMKQGSDHKSFKYFTLKGAFHERKSELISNNRATKEKKISGSGVKGILNDKTAKGYNECKLVCDGFEVQIVELGNNSTGEKDESIYGFKKINDVLRRIMQMISLDNISIDSLTRWVRASLSTKRYDSILQALKKQQSSSVDSNIIYDMCTIQLVHELLKEEQHSEKNIANTILYLLAKKYYLDKGIISQKDFTSFIQKNITPGTKEVDGCFNITIEELKNCKVGLLLLDFFKKCDNPLFLHNLLHYYKLKDRTQQEKIYKQLDDATVDTDNWIQLEEMSNQRVQEQKRQITSEIEHIFHTISGKSYQKQIQELTDNIEQGHGINKINNTIKWIFWEALLDKKVGENEHAPAIRKMGKKTIQYIGKGVVSTLQKVLRISGTYQELYPQLFELVKTYFSLIEFENKKSFLTTYAEGKHDFKIKQNSISFQSRYYQTIYNRIQKSGMYDEYRKLTTTYLTEYLKNHIGKSSDRAYFSENNEIVVKKIKPAKVARLIKMSTKHGSNLTSITNDVIN